MNDCRIRLAAPEDGPALLAIYAPYIRDTAVTFEYDVPTSEEFSQRVREITAFYPYLVCEREGEILGYAYAHRHKERAAYQWNVELSIYLARQACGQGVGTALYRTLIDLLTLQHVRNLYGCVTMPNDASDRLHRSLGFTCSGLWRHSGYKLGAWHDVAWYEKTAGDPQGDPAPLLSIHDLDPDVIRAALARWI